MSTHVVTVYLEEIYFLFFTVNTVFRSYIRSEMFQIGQSFMEMLIGNIH